MFEYQQNMVGTLNMSRILTPVTRGWNLPIGMFIRGHPDAIRNVIVGENRSVTRAQTMEFLTREAGVGFANQRDDVHGDGRNNWVSFPRRMRTENPILCAKIALLMLLSVNNLLRF